MLEGVTERKVREAVELVRRGFDEKKLRARLGENWELIVEIARARIKARDKFSRDDLWMDLQGLRYSTHETVAKYRAKRLKEFGIGSIADVSCGIGIQLIFYAMNVEKAYGIDIDPLKVEFARRNAEKYGVMVAAKGDQAVAVPLEQVAGVKKLVPVDHPWVESARRVGTSFGD